MWNAYCPFCKKVVSVMPLLPGGEALARLKKKQQVEVMHVANDGDHVFMTGRDSEESEQIPA
jgi:hypothetical protein